MPETDIITREDLQRFKDAVRKEATERAAKWAVAAVLVLMGFAFVGWWFYLKPKLIEFMGGMPSGSVVAFALQDGCPPGWSEFVEARGRVIVGAGEGIGLTRRPYLNQGGHESHNITIDELPAHNFQVSGVAVPASTDEYSAGGRPYRVIVPSSSPINTNTLGRGAQLDMMMPYVPIYYCKKNS